MVSLLVACGAFLGQFIGPNLVGGEIQYSLLPITTYSFEGPGFVAIRMPDNTLKMEAIPEGKNLATYESKVLGPAPRLDITWEIYLAQRHYTLNREWWWFVRTGLVSGKRFEYFPVDSLQPLVEPWDTSWKTWTAEILCGGDIDMLIGLCEKASAAGVEKRIAWAEVMPYWGTLAGPLPPSREIKVIFNGASCYPAETCGMPFPEEGEIEGIEGEPEGPDGEGEPDEGEEEVTSGNWDPLKTSCGAVPPVNLDFVYFWGPYAGVPASPNTNEDCSYCNSMFSNTVAPCNLHNVEEGPTFEAEDSGGSEEGEEEPTPSNAHEGMCGVIDNACVDHHFGVPSEGETRYGKCLSVGAFTKQSCIAVDDFIDYTAKPPSDGYACSWKGKDGSLLGYRGRAIKKRALVFCQTGSSGTGANNQMWTNEKFWHRTVRHPYGITYNEVYVDGAWRRLAIQGTLPSGSPTGSGALNDPGTAWDNPLPVYFADGGGPVSIGGDGSGTFGGGLTADEFARGLAANNSAQAAKIGQAVGAANAGLGGAFKDAVGYTGVGQPGVGSAAGAEEDFSDSTTEKAEFLEEAVSSTGTFGLEEIYGPGDTYPTSFTFQLEPWDGYVLDFYIPLTVQEWMPGASVLDTIRQVFRAILKIFLFYKFLACWIAPLIMGE